MESKSLWCFQILEFKSLWGCQTSGFKSLCKKSSRKLKAFARNPAGEAGAHNKIPALNCIKIPKRKISPPCSGLSKDPTNKNIKNIINNNIEGDGRYKLSVKRQDWDQRTPLQSSIHQYSISKDVIQELEATFDQTSFK